MTLIERLESRQEALKVRQVAEILGVSEKKIYHLAATGVLPVFRVGNAIRFDAQELADWLRKKKPSDGPPGPRKPHKDRSQKEDGNRREAGPPDHIWRGKLKSREAALTLTALSEKGET